MTARNLVSITMISVILAMRLNAQFAEPTTKEIDPRFDQAEEQLSKISYREVCVWEVFEESQSLSVFVSTTIQEFVPPDSSRLSYKTQAAKENTESETIRVGEKVYSRNEKRRWKIGEPDHSANFVDSPFLAGISSVSNRPRPKVEVNTRYIADELIDGIRTDFYEIKKISTLITNGVEVKKTSISKSWFNRSGTLHKTIFEEYSNGSKLLRRITSTYDYDSNIRIEVPIL